MKKGKTKKFICMQTIPVYVTASDPDLVVTALNKVLPGVYAYIQFCLVYMPGAAVIF